MRVQKNNFTSLFKLFSIFDCISLTRNVLLLNLKTFRLMTILYWISLFNIFSAHVAHGVELRVKGPPSVVIQVYFC